METLLSAFGTLTTRSPEEETRILRENLNLLENVLNTLDGNFNSIHVQELVARLERWNEIYRTQITWDLEMYPENMHENIVEIIQYFDAVQRSSNVKDKLIVTRNLYAKILSSLSV
jgi:uncharacterized protein YfbU (UPF0304 family)